MKAKRVQVFLPNGEIETFEDTEFQANPQFEQIVVFTDEGALSFSGCPWKVLADEEWTERFHELMGEAESLEMEQAKKMLAAARGGPENTGWFHG